MRNAVLLIKRMIVKSGSYTRIVLFSDDVFNASFTVYCLLFTISTLGF
ncbi:MAG: hypothetical protein WEC37_00175 [Anaerolineales bacterium]